MRTILNKYYLIVSLSETCATKSQFIIEKELFAYAKSSFLSPWLIKNGILHIIIYKIYLKCVEFRFFSLSLRPL